MITVPGRSTSSTPPGDNSTASTCADFAGDAPDDQDYDCAASVAFIRTTGGACRLELRRLVARMFQHGQRMTGNPVNY